MRGSGGGHSRVREWEMLVRGEYHAKALASPPEKEHVYCNSAYQWHSAKFFSRCIQ